MRGGEEMQSITITGKRTVYTIVKKMPYSCHGNQRFYLCKDGWGKYVLLYFEFDKKLDGSEGFREMGEIFFILRAACVDDVRLTGYENRESWFPTVDEVVSVPMGLIERKALVLRLDAVDVGNMLPLKSFFNNAGELKSFDLHTAVWLMRELALLSQIATEQQIYMQLYAGGILIDPERKRLTVYDYIRAPALAEAVAVEHEARDWRTVRFWREARWESLRDICIKILGHSPSWLSSLEVDEIRECCQDIELSQLLAILSKDYDSCCMQELYTVLCELGIKYASGNPDEYPFAMQEEELLIKKKGENENEN